MLTENQSKKNDDVDWESVIKSIDWNRVAKELAAYTGRLLKEKFWRGQFGGEVPGGQQIVDFVNNAITSFIDNPSKWDPRKRTLRKHLRNHILGEISNKVDLKENTCEIPGLDSFEKAGGFYGIDITSIEDKGLESLEIHFEQEQYEYNLLLKIKELGVQEIDLKIFELILFEPKPLKPREIAHFLSIDDEAIIYNAQKRLRRILSVIDPLRYSKVKQTTPKQGARRLDEVTQ